MSVGLKMPSERLVSSSWALAAASGILVQPSQTATVCELDQVRTPSRVTQSGPVLDSQQPRRNTMLP
jgi:hypothetical protein